MPSKKQKTGFRQLTLPFGDSDCSSKLNQNQGSNLISFSKHLTAKVNGLKIKGRKNRTKKIIDYANSLDW